MTANQWLNIAHKITSEYTLINQPSCWCCNALRGFTYQSVHPWFIASNPWEALNVYTMWKIKAYRNNGSLYFWDSRVNAEHWLCFYSRKFYSPSTPKSDCWVDFSDNDCHIEACSCPVYALLMFATLSCVSMLHFAKFFNHCTLVLNFKAWLPTPVLWWRYSSPPTFETDSSHARWLCEVTTWQPTWTILVFDVNVKIIILCSQNFEQKWFICQFPSFLPNLCFDFLCLFKDVFSFPIEVTG